MKIINEQFLTAKKDTNLRSLIVKSCIENNIKRTYMYLCVDVKNKYKPSKTDTAYIETDTEIGIDNYSQMEGNRREVETICFHITNLTFKGVTHLQTFLQAMKKDSDVSFKVSAYCGNDYYKELKLVSHKLTGIVDGKCYLLDCYVGANNSASPVREY